MAEKSRGRTKKRYQRVLRSNRSKGDFVTNQLLNRPKSKNGGWVYSAVDVATHLFQADHFLPTWDDTDHLHFVCAKCKYVADILAVKLDINYSNENKYALFLYLACGECGRTGQRKVYLDMRDKACKFQTTFDEGKIFFYGEERKPARVLDIFEAARKKAQK